MKIKIDNPPLPSAELIEYLSGIFIADAFGGSNWQRDRTGRRPLFGRDILLYSDRASHLNLGPSLKRALSYYQLDGLATLQELGLSVIDEVGYVGERERRWNLHVGEPKTLIESFGEGQAVLSSACRMALYQATLLAAHEGLAVVPAALYLLTLVLSSSELNRVTETALVIEQGTLYATDSSYSDLQRRVCRAPLEEFLAPETPLSTRYATNEEALVNALFDGVIPQFEFPANFTPLATLLIEQSISPGTWEPGRWRPVLITKDPAEVSRLSPLLSRRGMLYQGLPSPDRPIPSRLAVRSEDILYIWDHFRDSRST
ncbi:hypothetical protein [Ferrimicrobium acidiphilum]|uniref:hypothetical protein n=1 Tax=Ferrimicrobium acidiphilum TaxID=121039 RepID=UPI0023EF708B|nr:hypothetical protein [Ferrimicrobium acidiphilum]